MNIITGTLATLRRLAASVPAAICVGFGRHKYAAPLAVTKEWGLVRGIIAPPGTQHGPCLRCGEYGIFYPGYLPSPMNEEQTRYAQSVVDDYLAEIKESKDG